MQKKWLFMALLLLIGSKQLLSQSDCGTDQYMEKLRLHSPEFQLQQQLIERYTALLQKNEGLRSALDPDTVYTIKAVVQILHNVPEENFTDKQVKEQLAITNRDLSGLNIPLDNRWPQASSPKIRIVLADIDPDGNPTSGINRQFTGIKQFNTDDRMKKSQSGGMDAWPSDQYLNIWVCDLGRTLGYAQMPGGPSETDGVVVNYTSFGVNSLRYGYDLGHTLTHEVGHFIGLYHTYYGGCDGGDFVEDTPALSHASFGCQTTKATCGSLDMIENYMDASLDRCLSIFTEGQKLRMRAQLAPGGPRHSLLGTNADTTAVVVEPPVEDLACQAPRNAKLNNVGRTFEISWDGGNATQFLFEFKFANSSRWMAFPTNKPYLEIQGINASWSYSVRMTNICEDGQQSDSVEIHHNKANRKASQEPVHSISVYDFAGRHQRDLRQIEDYEASLFNLRYELPNGLYLLIKRDRKGRHLETEKLAVFR